MSDQVQSTPTRSGLKTGLQLGVIAIAAALAVACGGGGVGSNSTGSAGGFASGTVTGLGSIFVNGVEYNDAGTTVSGEDGDEGSRSDYSNSNTPLRVGMEVEVESNDVVCVTDSSVTPSVQVCTAKASSISYSSGLVGVVAGYTAATVNSPATFTVFGQTVNITAATHFSGVTVPTIANGNVVKVHGRPDATGQINATYVEVKAADVNSLPNGFKLRLRGTLDLSVPNAPTVAGQLVDLSGLDVSVKSALVTGQMVKVRIEPASVRPATGWVVASIKARKLAEHKGKKAELEGTISDAIVTPASTTQPITAGSTSFKVDGLQVIVANDNSVVYENGASYDLLQDGKLVEVKGSVNADGVLVASKIEFKSEATEAEIELKDTVSNVNVGAKTFEIRGYTVDFDASDFVSRRNKPFAIADLVAGYAGILEIKGHVDATSGHVIATSIKRDNN